VFYDQLRHVWVLMDIIYFSSIMHLNNNGAECQNVETKWFANGI